MAKKVRKTINEIREEEAMKEKNLGTKMSFERAWDKGTKKTRKKSLGNQRLIES